MRSSDWSSDVCSSHLSGPPGPRLEGRGNGRPHAAASNGGCGPGGIRTSKAARIGRRRTAVPLNRHPGQVSASERGPGSMIGPGALPLPWIAGLRGDDGCWMPQRPYEPGRNARPLTRSAFRAGWLRAVGADIFGACALRFLTPAAVVLAALLTACAAPQRGDAPGDDLSTSETLLHAHSLLPLPVSTTHGDTLYRNPILGIDVVEVLADGRSIAAKPSSVLFVGVDITSVTVQSVTYIYNISLDHLLFWKRPLPRSEAPTSELQSLMRISYAVFCLKKKNKTTILTKH